MLDVVVWLVMGGLVGWMTSAIMQANSPRGHGWNVCVGAVGAVLSGWFVSPWLGASALEAGTLNLGPLLVAVVGAVLCLAVLNLFRREEDTEPPFR